MVGPLLTLLLLLGVGLGIWYSSQGKQAQDRADAVEPVKGLSGSDKLPYLHDPRVLARLERLGIRLSAQKAGSREIALRPDLKHLPCENLIKYVQDRPGHDRRYAIDARKLERELGWKPAETFETGIRKTVRWYLDNVAWWEPLRSGRYTGERLGLLKSGSK